MNTILWICQILLAIIFGYSGITKGTLSQAKLLSMGQTGVQGLSLPLMRFIGISEMLGMIGIIVPWLINVLPALTPFTALCFATINLLAARVHYKLKENKTAFAHILMLLTGCFIAYFRFKELYN